VRRISLAVVALSLTALLVVTGVTNVISQQASDLVDVTSRNLSKRWKVWGTLARDVNIEPSGSVFMAWRLTVPTLEGSQVRVESITVKILNGRSISGQDEVWLEYWLYTGCLTEDPASCDQSAKISSHIFYLKPDGIASSLVDIPGLVKADGSIYVFEIKNTSNLTIFFGSVEYVFVFCQSTASGGECIN
jgi:hypothetical protein